MPARVRLIQSQADIRAGVRALRRRCAVMRQVHDIAGDPPIRRLQPGFEGLARIVVGQQLSTASAAAIWARFVSGVQPMTAAALVAASDDVLRGVGLSRPKIRTLRAMSTAVLDGLDLERLVHEDDDAVREALTTVSGIGPWTADIFLMFCLGRADSFAAGDLALQVAAQHAMALEARPRTEDLLVIAERWRPWRGVAAGLLWAYYKAVKETGTKMPV
ncbi:MAG: DNA-3-methyladenine glycosylase family protein [Hyphomicrobiaceae bacterium]